MLPDLPAQDAYHSIKSSTPQADLDKFLVLTQIPGLGFKRLSKTASLLGCRLFELREQSTESLAGLSWSDEQVAALKGPVLFVGKIREWLKKSSCHSIVCFEHAAYPPLLKQINQPPLVLYCNGNIDLLHGDFLAVVGSRKVSREGQLNTQKLVSDIARLSTLGIVSGMALGVDGLAHQSCLDHGGQTIAVLGCGIDVIYPLRHKNIYQKISQNGLIVSEFLPGTKPEPHFFPRRNRIISGLALGTMVTEAQIKSGTLVTANCSIEQNREVFAVPGNIRNPNVSGCHWLIKQGAALTENVDDILHVLGDKYKKPTLDNDQAYPFDEKDKQSLATDLLLDSVDYESTPIDLIARRAGMLIPDVLVTLLEYEMRGLVASTSQGYIKLRE